MTVVSTLPLAFVLHLRVQPPVFPKVQVQPIFIQLVAIVALTRVEITTEIIRVLTRVSFFCLVHLILGIRRVICHQHLLAKLKIRLRLR